MLSFKMVWVGIIVMVVAQLPIPVSSQEYTPTGTAPYSVSELGYQRITFDPTGTRLAVAVKSTDAREKVVFLNVPDLAVIREIHTDSKPTSLAFSRQGDLFAIGLIPAAPPNDLSFVVLSTANWKPVYSDRELKSPPTSLIFDPVGDFLLTGTGVAAGINRYMIGTWKREKVPPLDGIETWNQALTISPDGLYSAAGVTNARLLVWLNDDSGKASSLGIQQFKGIVNAVAFNKDSTQLAAGDSQGNIMVFYLTDDRLWAWRTVFTLPSGMPVTGIGFLSDGSLVTSSNDGLIGRWNLADTTAPFETIQVGANQASTLALDPQGRWLAAGGEKITVYPLGSPIPQPSTEMPSAPFTIVDKTAPDTLPATPALGSIRSTTEVSIPAPPSEDQGNFLLWLALGKTGGDGQDWIQPWAGLLDDGHFHPLQLILPYQTLNAGVMKSNLGNIGKVLTPKDFCVLYASAILDTATKEGSPDLPLLSFGANPEQTTPFIDLVQAIQTAAGIVPTVWVLDLQHDAQLPAEQVQKLFQKMAQTIEMNEDKTPRTPLGVGLLTVSPEEVYQDLSGHVSEGLSGKADSNSNGKISDMEIVRYLSEHCRTATRLQVIGEEKHDLPVLPQFSLRGR